MTGKKIDLVIVDPQADFCSKNIPATGKAGALYVDGAEEDVKNIVNFIKKFGKELNDIHVTLDSHQALHIAHPSFWINSNGEHPNPFTLITKADIDSGTWRAAFPPLQAKAKAYVETLEKNARYVLCIWPEHCLIGSPGHGVVPELAEVLHEWSRTEYALVNYVTKGSNPFTEHYSAIKADVIDPEDPTTDLNVNFIQLLMQSDEVLFTGEALSHCVANTFLDVADEFGDDNVKKLVFLEDTSSNVPAFETLGTDFINKMKARGMRISNTKDYSA